MPPRPPRRGKLRARLELCLSAFTPAFGLMTWRASGEPLAWLFGFVTVSGLVVFIAFLLAMRSGNTQPYMFEGIWDSSSDVLGHIAIYLAVAVIDPKVSASEAILAVIVLGLIFLVHVSVGLVHVNPLFYVVGYRVYTGITNQGNSYYLVARTDVADWVGSRHLVRMSDGILIEGRRYAA